MGGLLVVFKIMPEGAETDLETVKNEVRKLVTGDNELQGFQVEPIAFGLKALKVSVVMPDAEGGPDQLEEAFGGIEGVGSVVVSDMGRF